MDSICRRVAIRTAVVITVLVILLLEGSAGAVPAEEWNKTFKGMQYEAFSVPQTSDGGYLITTLSFTLETSFDVWLIKIDANGKEQWRKLFKGQNWDWVGSVQQARDGGYIFAGFTESHEWGNRDAWLVKTDPQGNEQWSKRFGGTDTDNAASVQQTEDGGYIFAGATKSFGSGKQDAWLIKTDSNGNQQWMKIFGETGDDGVHSVQRTLDNGYILSGWTDSYGVGSFDAWIIKVDENGNQQWNKTFGGASHDEASLIQQTMDGGYIFTGLTKSYGAGDTDAWLLKIDSTGSEQWSKTFGGDDTDNAVSVQQTSDKGYILVGSTKSYGAGDFDAWIIKTDSNGNQLWSKTIGGADTDMASSITQTLDNGYVVAGNTAYGVMWGQQDSWLIKLSSEIPTSTPTLTETITETQIASPTEKTSGFEIVLAMTILLFALIIRRKRNK